MILLQMSPGEAVFVGETLKGLGLPGAIIIVLMSIIAILGGVIGVMYRQANKVYGYRLAERDTLNKALTDSSSVIAGMVKATEERNVLTEEQAELIDKQGQAFELLKVTILNQYETIKNNQTIAATAVEVMSASIRQMNQVIMENRGAYTSAIEGIRNTIAAALNDIKMSNHATMAGMVQELRNQAGRRKSPP